MYHLNHSCNRRKDVCFVRDLPKVLPDGVRSILARRSVRRFHRDRPVEDWKRDCILAAATAAPSAKGIRPFRFLVLEDRAILDSLADALSQGIIFKEAPLAIAVCGDLSSYPKDSLGWLEDCSAALENMLIAATSLDLSSVWFGVYRRSPKEEQVREVLKVPPHVEVQGIAVIGYGAEEQPPREGIDLSLIGVGTWDKAFDMGR